MAIVNATFKTDIKKNTLAQVVRNIKLMNGLATKVGFPEGAPVGSNIRPLRENQKLKTSMDQIARVVFRLEFGASDLGDKKWPVMSIAFLKNKTKIQLMIENMYEEASKSKSKTLKALAKVGEFHAENVREEIKTIRTPTLSEAWIVEKESDKPYIDLGQTLQSVTHVEAKV